MVIHHETIYRYVAGDKANGGTLWQSLRRSQRVYKKRYGRVRGQGRVPGCRDISERPGRVKARRESGHRKGDTVRDGPRNRSFVTFVERKTRLPVLAVVPSLHSDVVASGVRDALSSLKAHTSTGTFDNEEEFCDHRSIAKALDADVFFAKPYHSWERGTNENTNGLILQCFPKRKLAFKRKVEGVREVERRLNSRPRKCLGYMTPAEAFEKGTGVIFT